MWQLDDMTLCFQYKNKEEKTYNALKQKLKQKAQEFKLWIKTHRNLQLKEMMAIVKLIGHYNYYGITDNSIGINKY